MLIVPTQPIPNQTLNVQLGGQACILEITQFEYGMFMTVMVGNSLVVAGVICENLNRIVRSLYLGFQGDFVFFDTQGTEDPVFTGLNSRFVLLYLTPSDLGGVG